MRKKIFYLTLTLFILSCLNPWMWGLVSTYKVNSSIDYLFWIISAPFFLLMGSGELAGFIFGLILWLVVSSLYLKIFKENKPISGLIEKIVSATIVIIGWFIFNSWILDFMGAHYRLGY